MKNRKFFSLFIATLILNFVFTLASIQAQTQKIAYKSHSGKTSNFVANEKSKNNLGLSPQMEAFWDLKQDSVALIHYLKDSTTGIEIIKALKKNKTQKEYVKFIKTKKGQNLKQEMEFSRFNHDINESLLLYDYNLTRKYILELLERHKDDKKENSSGSIFFNSQNYQNYAFLFFFIGMFGLAGWLYKESKTV